MDSWWSDQLPKAVMNWGLIIGGLLIVVERVGKFSVEVGQRWKIRRLWLGRRVTVFQGKVALFTGVVIYINDHWLVVARTVGEGRHQRQVRHLTCRNRVEDVRDYEPGDEQLVAQPGVKPGKASSAEDLEEVGAEMDVE